MFILVIAIAFWAYQAFRLARSRRTTSAEPRPLPPDPSAGIEGWSSIDDIQLTRLLRHAANGG